MLSIWAQISPETTVREEGGGGLSQAEGLADAAEAPEAEEGRQQGFLGRQLASV